MPLKSVDHSCSGFPVSGGVYKCLFYYYYFIIIIIIKMTLKKINMFAENDIACKL